MARIFKTMNNHVPIHLLDYVAGSIEKNPNLKVYVGTDSQNYKKTTVYVSTVVLRYEQNGAQVLYEREYVDKITDRWTRLWNELQRSIDLACYLREEGGFKIEQIDLDYNSDPKYFSNKLFSAAVGYVQAMGYEPKAKPDMLMATWAANVLCN